MILSPPQRIGALTIPYEVPILVWSGRKSNQNRIEPQQKQRTYSALIRWEYGGLITSSAYTKSMIFVGETAEWVDKYQVGFGTTVIVVWRNYRYTAVYWWFPLSTVKSAPHMWFTYTCIMKKERGIVLLCLLLRRLASMNTFVDTACVLRKKPSKASCKGLHLIASM